MTRRRTFSEIMYHRLVALMRNEHPMHEVARRKADDAAAHVFLVEERWRAELEARDLRYPNFHFSDSDGVKKE